MTHDTSITALLALFRRTPHFVITSHERPDGDAIGSVLALAEILDQLGCSSEVVLVGPAPDIYSTLPNIDRVRFAPAASSAPCEQDGLAPVIVLECDSVERTGLRGLEDRFLINIDHHASSRNFGVINWIDPSACAVAAMVYRLAVAAEFDVEITASMATCLYTAILSDTGSFNYPGTNAESFAIAHDLTLHGANPGQIARDLYHTNSLGKVRILGTALNSLQVSGNLAWSWVTRNDLSRAEATPEDCEGIVSNLVSIDGVEAAFLLREQLDGLFRLSLRSKGNIDVALVAESFGGGGHKTASGCTLRGPLHVAIDRLLAALRAGQPGNASGAAHALNIATPNVDGHNLDAPNLGSL